MLVQWFRGTATPASLCSAAGVCGSSILQNPRLNKVILGGNAIRHIAWTWLPPCGHDWQNCGRFAAAGRLLDATVPACTRQALIY